MRNEDELVLVIDGDEDIRQVVRDFLTDEGYRVLAVETREDARDVLARETVSLVLLDTTERGAACHERPPFARTHPPLVLFSAAGDLTTRARAVGAVGWIAKPFALDELLKVVQQHISS